MMVLKYVYTVLLILYIGMIATWCMRYPISYKIVGVKPDFIEERSLAHQEYKALEKAVEIRRSYSKILLYASLVTFIASVFFFRNRFEPAIIVKVAMIVAAIIALILILVNGIQFIPGPPIR